MTRLTRYFNETACEIDSAARKLGLTNNRGDIGNNREILLKSFLNNHLPRRLEAIQGGIIYGFDNQESSQIDIIVANDISLKFPSDCKLFSPIECAASAITVKSYLDKQALIDCLTNIASIPQVNEKILELHLKNKNQAISDYKSYYPSLFIFAYDGMSYNVCLKHTIQFYKENKNIPLNRYPCGIIVNMKYIILFKATSYTTTDGFEVEPYKFFPVSLEDNRMYGYPLIVMLDSLQKYISWLNYINIDIRHYFNKEWGVTDL